MSQRSRARREEREKQKRRNQQMYIVGALVVVAALVLILVIVSNQPTDAPIPASVNERYAGIEQSVNEKGYPVLGNADAGVSVVEYASFGCPGCGDFHSTAFSMILDFVKTGNVSFTYVPMLTGEGNVEGAARAALCAERQDKFWEMHDTLFGWREQFVGAAFNQNRLLAGVDALGLNRDQFNSCFNSQPVTEVITAAGREGIAQTPTVTVNGSQVPATRDDVANAINQALALVGPSSQESEPTVVPPETTPQEATPEVTAEISTDSEVTPEATSETSGG